MNAKKLKLFSRRKYVKMRAASPFRRRYLGFRVLGKDEEVREGDQLRHKKFWGCMGEEFIRLLNLDSSDRYTIRRKL